MHIRQSLGKVPLPLSPSYIQGEKCASVTLILSHPSALTRVLQRLNHLPSYLLLVTVAILRKHILKYHTKAATSKDVAKVWRVEIRVNWLISENTKLFPVPRGDLVGRGSMLSIGGNGKKNDSGGGVSYTSGGYLPVDTR